MVKINDVFILKHDVDGSKEISGFDIGVTVPLKYDKFTSEMIYNSNNDGSLLSVIRNWNIKSKSYPMAINIGFGGCIHDGELSNRNKTEYGSRLLFKTNVGFQYDQLELFGWHISNANLKGENEGNTAVGIKYYLNEN
ncbi:Lipid A 3-O-deacylase (PagL) [seawater metagenome]|uniref:Lipid A 3-O-deacylase (PagL) n=1 Tax=seawater metagenome TaxID=1561972 RepID=A0A5E8CGV0_9ZZZZ